MPPSFNTKITHHQVGVDLQRIIGYSDPAYLMTGPQPGDAAPYLMMWNGQLVVRAVSWKGLKYGELSAPIALLSGAELVLRGEVLRQASAELAARGLRSWRQASIEAPQLLAQAQAQASCALICAEARLVRRMSGRSKERGNYPVEVRQQAMDWPAEIDRGSWEQLRERCSDPEWQQLIEPTGPALILGWAPLKYGRLNDDPTAINLLKAVNPSGRITPRPWPWDEDAPPPEDDWHLRIAAERLERSAHQRQAQARTAVSQSGLQPRPEEQDLAERYEKARRGESEGDKNDPARAWIKDLDYAYSQLLSQWPALRPLIKEIRIEIHPTELRRAKVSGAALRGHDLTLLLNLASPRVREHLDEILLKYTLHAALGHHLLPAGRPGWRYSLACSLKVAAFLEESQVEVPQDWPRWPELESLTSNEIDQALSEQERQARRLETVRGGGLPDLIYPSDEQSEDQEALEQQLDEAEARLLAAMQQDHLRQILEDGELAGIWSAGLIRELRTRSAKPIPWRDALQGALSKAVPRIQRSRSYHSLSRRSRSHTQPKPGWQRGEPGPEHDLIVVADTSGSVSNRDLELALGAIIATARTLDIGRVRLISCDTVATDHGWIRPQDLRQRAKLTGGGGTELNTAVLMAEHLGISERTPMLIVTDGELFSPIFPQRTHAYLLPRRCVLNFRTSAPQFEIKE